MKTASVTRCVILCALIFAFPHLSRAAVTSEPDLIAGIKDGLMTAVLHANDFARQGDTAAALKRHLQHTINCLEGPTGMHFRPAAGNLCQGKGHGIIPDLQAAVAQGVPGAERALTNATVAWSLAIKAMGMTDVNEAQPWALVAAKYLKMASDDLSR